MRRVLLVLAAAATVAGCAGAPAGPGPRADSADEAVRTPAAATPLPTPPTPPAVPKAPATSPSPVAAAGWRVGASPLPLRDDGFGQVLPTPPELRDRRMTARSRLAPPPADRFASTITAVTPAVRARMGATWSPACPVALTDLRYLTVSFRGFDGTARTGELVTHADVATDVVTVFRRLFADAFPIEEMRLPTTADLEAAPTGDGNNTASYVCRAARGQKTWSQHAYGRAVDINPFHNPLLKGDLVVPELASAYRDRRRTRPGMHVSGGAAVRAFAAVGWEWGGDWRSLKDYMHFSRNGR